MKRAEDFIIEITNVEYVSDLKLRVKFSDCNERLIDFGPFLGNSRHPEIRKYMNPDVFKKFKIEYGDLVWNDYDLCLLG